jgi:hypothetical protein
MPASTSKKIAQIARFTVAEPLGGRPGNIRRVERLWGRAADYGPVHTYADATDWRAANMCRVGPPSYAFPEPSWLQVSGGHQRRSIGGS